MRKANPPKIINMTLCRFHLHKVVLFLAAASWLVMGAIFASETGVSSPTCVVSLDGSWLLATDPKNVGREEKWFEQPRPEAKQAKVPWIIQDAFPGYHGVAWYWRDFNPPANPRDEGRYLLRFWQVDYMADVWVNGVHVGRHEGGEGVFVLDVTEAVKPNQKNMLTVRVLNPTNEPIDGVALAEVPRRCKSVPFYAGGLYNDGGIVDSVELLLAPAVRFTNLKLDPDSKTGEIHVQAVVHNASAKNVKANLECIAAPGSSGETLQSVRWDRELPPGDTTIETTLQVPQRRLWELNDPYLYRVTARVQRDASKDFDEVSSRCGFRDFRFENGYFRLNGKRIFVKCSHTATHYPIGLHWPHDPDLARRDLLNVKAMGFNAIRFFCAVPTRYQLDLCDEIGLMVYEESYAGWLLQPSAQMGERFNREVKEMIERDRNHPSIVMWGLLNETGEGPVFRHAVAMLPFVRSLDNNRMVMLNSGLFQFVSTGVIDLRELLLWKSELGTEPVVTFNATNEPISVVGATWQPQQFGLHPGRNGEYSVMRWTAPAAGDYVVSAQFTGIAEKATTDVHVLHQGKPLFDGFINIHDNGNEAAFEKTVKIAAGETIDWVVGVGNGQFAGDTTAVAATIRDAMGNVWDAARNFSATSNPQGPWSYGYFKPDKAPDAASFKLFMVTKDKPLPTNNEYGALSNPGSSHWEDIISDQHPYKRVPHTAGVIRELRTLTGAGQPVWMSEYGIGSGVDFARITRHFEQLGVEHVEDAQWYRQQLNEFMVDWKRWNMDDMFANPEEFFARCLAKMGKQRLLGLNAIRANPNIIGHSVTGTVDQANTGEGLFTTFRELKPGTVDAMFDGWYPLRWCLFVEPVQVYRNTPVRFDAVLANEDALKPGKYPARLQIVGPNGKSVFDRKIEVIIPDPSESSKTTQESPFAIPVFSEKVVVDGPPGKYRFLATFEQGAAATGGDIEFYVGDAGDLPKIDNEVVLWSSDPKLDSWLKGRGIHTRPYSSTPPAARELILASNAVPAPGSAAAFRELASRIARGASVVFLSPTVFSNGDQSSAFVPLANKGKITGMSSWLYHKDEWAKNHPIFDGLPAGGLMDYAFYREIIPDIAFLGQDTPAEAVAGATNTSQGYNAGLLVSVNSLGDGRFILNSLNILENLGHNPAADRLLLNMLRYAASDASKPLADLPPDFEEQLKAMHY